MELMIRRPTKGLDLLPLSQDATVTSVGIEENSGGHQFLERHSLYLIHLVSDISYEAGHSIRFFQAFDRAALTRNPP